MKKEHVVPIDIQSELGRRANIFSAKHLRNGCRFIPDARGKFIYIRLWNPDEFLENYGRLTYTGNKENMEFAIFLYSSEKYSFDYFPGSEHLDGTLEGALKAIMKAY